MVLFAFLVLLLVLLGKKNKKQLLGFDELCRGGKCNLQNTNTLKEKNGFEVWGKAQKKSGE